MRKIIFTQQQIDNIINDYVINNISTRQLGTKYNVSKTVISRVLKENNIELNHTNRKYFGDYDKFQKIDSAEKAYWLGFLAADGCNYSRAENASVIINIHQKDIQHLYKFQNFMNTNAQVKTFIQNQGFSNNTPMCKIILNSKKLSKDLSNVGIVPKKSLILQPPKINSKFYLPFILGYFDGDGSIFETNQKSFGISIEGTKEILEWINSILNISSHLEKRKQDNSNNYFIRCGGINKPYLIMKQLYNSVNIHLDRKYNIFKTLETVVLNGNIK